MHAYRTHTCGALRASDAGQTARLSGWIHSKRDYGGLLFLDLRDHYGITQCVLSSGEGDLRDLQGAAPRECHHGYWHGRSAHTRHCQPKAANGGG